MHSGHLKALGSITWRGRVRGSVYVPPIVNSCADYSVCLTPPSCVQHAPKLYACVRALKTPYPSVVQEEQAPQPVAWSHTNTARYTGLLNNSGWVAGLCGSWLSSGGGKRPEFPVGKIPIGTTKSKEKNKPTNIPPMCKCCS